MDVRSCTRRWPAVILVFGMAACADQGDTELDTEIDAVPAAETTPTTTAGTLSEAEVMQAVTAVNQAEIEEAELARSKSENAEVREFAEMMITDHTRMLEETRQISGTDATGTTGTDTTAGTTGTDTGAAAGTPPAGVGNSPQGAGVIQQLQQESQTALQELESLTGAEFDEAYIARQVEAHQNALDLIEMQILPSVQDPQMRQTLESARPVIQQHLQRAQELQQQLGSGTTGTDTTGTGGTGS